MNLNLSLSMAPYDYATPDGITCFFGTDIETSLKLFHANMQSAKNKTTSLETLLSELKIDFSVVMLTETSYENTDYYFHIPQYRICNLNRKYGR